MGKHQGGRQGIEALTPDACCKVDALDQVL